MSSIVLHYQLEPPEGSSTLLAGEDMKCLKRLGMQDGKLSLRITLATQEIRFEYGEGNQRILALELHNGRRTWIDHAMKEKLILDQTPEFLKLVKSKDGAWQIEQSAASKQFEVTGLNLIAQHMHLVGKLVTIEAWIAQPVLDFRPATQMLWMLLAPGSSVETASLGIPLVLEITDAKSHHDILLRWKLLEYTSSEKEPDPLQAPADYKEPVTKPPDAKDLAKIVGLPMKTHEEGFFARSNTAAALEGILSGQGDDLAWMAREPILAQAKEVVNKISSVFDCFEGDGEGGNKPMHVLVDWWKDLDKKLVFNNKDGAMRALETMWLAYRVMEGLVLAGMNAQEQETYEQILASNVGWKRIVQFWSMSSSARVNELMEINFLELTKPVCLEFKRDGEPVKSWRKNDVMNLFDIKLWDFDTEIHLANQPIFQDLSFGTGVIELVLKIPLFKMDFQFWTKPNGSLKSIVLAPVLFNYGYGAFSAINVKIALRIGAIQQGGATTFQVQVDTDHSQVHAIAALYGVNLVEDILAGVYSTLAYWLELWKPMVLDIVNQAATKICSQPALGWPAFWHARNGPPVVSDGVGHSLRTLKGQLVTNPADLPESSSAANFAKASMAGFVVSRQYLTAWLRNLLGEYMADRILEINWQEQFGVTLPDIAVFAIPENLTENVDGTSVSELSRYYRTRIHRFAPVVNLPTNGQSAASGTAEIHLTLTLEVVVKLRHTEIGVVERGRTRVVETSKIPGQYSGRSNTVQDGSLIWAAAYPVQEDFRAEEGCQGLFTLQRQLAEAVLQW